MKEWKNPYNSFNSMKGLLYSRWYNAIREWKDGKRPAPLPPIEASLDPIHACNLQCEHCNASRYLNEGLKGRRITDEHLEKLVKFLGKWGVKAICFGGGGEPTLHPYLKKALYLTKDNGMDVSVVTNGTLLTPDLMIAMVRTCRWIGISVDASTAKTYQIGRKADLFDKTIFNIKWLCDWIKLEKNNYNKCDVAFKFLIFDYNQYEIYDACKLAKELGVRDFHARPADFTHQGMDKKKIQNPYNLKVIEQQFEKCHELADENFNVYTIVHKFDENFIPRKNFEQCYASPCCIQLCADGWIYLCPDQRHQKLYSLGRHFPDPMNILQLWGSAYHYKLVFESGKTNCKTRCTFAPYCKQCEELFIKDTDPMCKWFI